MARSHTHASLIAMALAMGFVVAGPAQAQADHAAHARTLAEDMVNHDSIDSANAHGITVDF